MEGLNIKEDGIYFDGTLGGAGHSFEILKRCTRGRLIATDLDDEAIAAAKERLSPYEGRFSIYKSNYKDYEQVFAAEKVDKVDGVLLDFGVSSHQLDDVSRGFSYMAKDAPLDMRMDESAALTAEEVVNTYSVEDLTRIFKEYGEERFAFQIAKNIERARAHKTIQKSGELTEIIESSIPWKFRQNGPCQRKVFQAIRIEVNGELEGLKECVIGLTRRLKKGGRIAVLTFHSLEDRITKTAFRELAASCNCPPSFPVCVCGKKSEIRIITGKPLVASEEEQGENSRSKCAKLRVAERILD
jgi:16S rRNA (cytosine1402-N4)-methyltransferase